jgi:hypothetical protein
MRERGVFSRTEGIDARQTKITDVSYNRLLKMATRQKATTECSEFPSPYASLQFHQLTSPSYPAGWCVYH